MNYAVYTHKFSIFSYAHTNTRRRERKLFANFRLVYCIVLKIKLYILLPLFVFLGFFFISIFYFCLGRQATRLHLYLYILLLLTALGHWSNLFCVLVINYKDKFFSFFCKLLSRVHISLSIFIKIRCFFISFFNYLKSTNYNDL
jgi:hypothetical protein